MGMLGAEFVALEGFRNPRGMTGSPSRPAVSVRCPFRQPCWKREMYKSMTHIPEWAQKSL